MIRNQALGLVLLALGVVANNYVYLHDLIQDRHDGWIFLGETSFAGIGLSLLVMALGLVLVLRYPHRGND